MWLRDSLPRSFSQLRLWIYGYESNLLDKDDIGDVHEDAENFRQHLRILRQKTKVGISLMYILNQLTNSF
jgi:endo-beta-N-acetylglucosaminidase D